MLKQLRLLEFVCVYPEKTEHPLIGLYDAETICNISSHDNNHCWISFKNNDKKLVCGTYRTLTNRWIYSLEKKNLSYQDDILRPSVMITHNPDTMSINSSYCDSYQLKQFILAINPQILSKYQYLFDEYDQFLQ
jgi:hypothetical protein